MKFFVLTSAIVALTFGLTACEPDAPPPPPPPAPKEVPPPPPPVPPKLTPAEATRTALACHGKGMASRDVKHVSACWAPDGRLAIPGMPELAGRDAIGGFLQGFLAMSTDFKITPILTLTFGMKIAQVRHISGTNDGSFMGAPPTGKKFSLLGLALDTVDDQGHIVSGSHYFDMPTMMAQLGMAKMPSRPVTTAPGEPTEIAATASKIEADNLAAVNASHASYNSKDIKKMLAMFADDIVLSDQEMPTDVKGKKAVAGVFKMFGAAFPDMKVANIDQWAAGDYVVSQLALTATNTGDLKMMKLKKTGKSVNLHVAQIALVQGGKAKNLWWFGNSAELAMQLGLTPPPGPPPAAPGLAAPQGPAKK